ncbi:uncharacterized protein METZ01_LOCUS259252, partial [marine metagenome]
MFHDVGVSLRTLKPLGLRILIAAGTMVSAPNMLKANMMAKSSPI